ncbi:hypothetical protein CHLRE_04g215150v5 [Chlamydomonas reinhardtii]|uniref:Starch synthase, chloroplastic/amyloplastic n=1 Tax=Chlamydomonas reinhardtii TaxID=3055 RepID=A0A2K3DTR8_CHLRE|nr:uncharacterized protein CHLRE_04g215150v5 [Chlamydomonas reinhardtii]PNW83927.1 hypothetical protein CHLRE_04g215150v5 [Chlamydomonas reinhardtii]
MLLQSGRPVPSAQARALRRAAVQSARPCRVIPGGRSAVRADAAAAIASPAVAVEEALPGIETTHDKNVHGTAGSVVVEQPGLKRASTLRNIMFVTSEVAPWSKTGGLADVLGSLPFALAERGHRVMVVSPRWVLLGRFRYSLLTLAAMEAPFFLELPVPPQQQDPPRSPTALAAAEAAAAAAAKAANGSGPTAAAIAEIEAVVQAESSVPKTKYGQDIMFVANDWHTSLIPVYLAAKYRPHGVYGNARAILAIHNLRHQGVFPPYTYESLGLPPHWYGCLEWQYPPHQRQGSWAEEGRSVNHLKAGLTTADRVVTVSAGYAEEIKTYLGGWGMEGIIAARDPVLNGIVNGIDTDEWNPSIDPHLPATYDATNFVEGKAKCKMELQRELGLPVNEHIPLVAFIGRLDPQKGADILLEAAPALLRHNNVQLVCLGSGNKDLEDGLRWLEAEFKDRARGWVGFNVPFSHKLTAAADILLMPSRFEPCGLNQLYAMRYGAVPVAHKTGGLRDTVLDFNPWAQEGTGWTYTSCDAQGLLHAVGVALLTYNNHKEDFRKLQLRGMAREASWDGAAQQYEQIIDWAFMDPPYCR